MMPLADAIAVSLFSVTERTKENQGESGGPGTVPSVPEFLVRMTTGAFAFSYASPLTRTVADAFLLAEWKKKKKADLYLHDELKSFLSQYFPKIKFAVDVEKRAVIDELVHSSNFAATHFAIAGLLPFIDALTNDEVTELFDAARHNSQIRWILADDDVRSFYSPLVESMRDNRRITTKEYKAWRERLAGVVPEF